MKYDEWEPVYQEICEYFDFDPDEDHNAALILSELTPADASDALEKQIAGNCVTVCGNAPGLSSELDSITGVVIAADAAAGVLYAHKIVPDVIVTDLDGIDTYALDLNRQGTILVVHAHGDNISRLKTWVPKFTGPVVCTTQGKPFANIHNFGGFTDGDRAVYLATEMQAAEIRIIGFDCDDPGVTPMKKGKLSWARTLLTRLGYDC